MSDTRLEEIKQKLQENEEIYEKCLDYDLHPMIEETRFLLQELENLKRKLGETIFVLKEIRDNDTLLVDACRLMSKHCLMAIDEQ